MSSLSTGPVVGAARVFALPDLGGVSLTSQQTDALPKGFPAKLDTKLAWVGSDFKDSETYFYQLTQADLAEISQAITHFKSTSSINLVTSALIHFHLFFHFMFPSTNTHFNLGLGLDGEHVSRDTFPLPQLGAKLDELSTEVHKGRGFCLVRGVNPADYSVEDLTLVYLGVQTHIADQRAHQDSRGNMLGECLSFHATFRFYLSLTLAVHIIADKSSKTSTEHHRHSNKSIVSHMREM